MALDLDQEAELNGLKNTPADRRSTADDARIAELEKLRDSDDGESFRGDDTPSDSPEVAPETEDIGEPEVTGVEAEDAPIGETASDGPEVAPLTEGEAPPTIEESADLPVEESPAGEVPEEAPATPEPGMMTTENAV